MRRIKERNVNNKVLIITNGDTEKIILKYLKIKVDLLIHYK